MKIYDIRASVGEYQKDGKSIRKYTTIGAVLETKNGGKMIKLDVLPTNWEGFAYLNEPLPPKGDKTDGASVDIPDEAISLKDLPF